MGLVRLLIEPFGGMAGDMFLAGLLDLAHPAFDLDVLASFVQGLVPEPVELGLDEVRRRGIRGKHLRVFSSETVDPPHRHLKDMLSLLDRSGLGEEGCARAAAILRRLGEAEARIHGIPVEKVHFHEVGAIDTLIDVGGAVLALERLGVSEVRATAPYAGGGTVRCAHGELPVPAPATEALMEGRALRRGPGGERLTPTAAAVLAELAHGEPEGESWAAQRTGYGAGTRDPEEGPPNLLRVSLGPVASEGRADQAGGRRTQVWLLECNLDDVTGEELGFLVATLREAGALEAWSVPVQMKKDRPGAIVTALCRPEDRDALEVVAFTHSPTLGVRWSRRERTECAREERTVLVGTERVRIKVRHWGDVRGELDLSPEFEDLARVARRTGRPLRSIEREVIEAARREERDPG